MYSIVFVWHSYPQLIDSFMIWCTFYLWAHKYFAICIGSLYSGRMQFHELIYEISCWEWFLQIERYTIDQIQRMWTKKKNNSVKENDAQNIDTLPTCDVLFFSYFVHFSFETSWKFIQFLIRTIFHSHFSKFVSHFRKCPFVWSCVNVVISYTN